MHVQRCVVRLAGGVLAILACCGTVRGQVVDTTAAPVTVRGFVRDAETREPLVGGRVMLVNQPRCGAATHADGSYRLTCVRPGTSVFLVSYIGYPTLLDTVEISSDTVERVINFTLSDHQRVNVLWMSLFSTDERNVILSYRDSLQSLQARGAPLQITIDSLWWIEHDHFNLHARLQYVNHSDMSIYVLRSFPPVLTCLFPVFVNPRGDTVKSHVAYYDYMGMKDEYEEGDLLEIPARASVRSEATFDVESRFPPDRYRVRITYRHHMPEIVGRYLSVRTHLLVQLKAIEGEIQSDNEYMLTVPQHAR